jgi:hypothetical protein
LRKINFLIIALVFVSFVSCSLLFAQEKQCSESLQKNLEQIVNRPSNQAQEEKNQDPDFDIPD